jgi:hypothetical protein
MLRLTQRGGTTLRGIIALATALAVAATLTVGLSSAGAGTRFAYTAQIDDNHDLVVQFQEGKLRRFASADYQLQGDAISRTPNLAALYEGLTASVTLVPDEQGRASGSLTLDIPTSPSPEPCTCGGLRIEYFNLTLQNLTTGRTYHLQPVSRDFP